MKRTIILCLAVLMPAVIIPFAVGFGGIKSKEINESAAIITSVSPDKTEMIDTTESAELDYIICNAMEYIDESSDTETKKAVIALCSNNLLFYTENNTSPPELNIDTYSDSLYDELCEIYSELNIEILYKNQIVYIPLTEISPGYTSESKDYPYMRSVASPWDTFSPLFKNNLEQTCGVSIAGINYLCENGSDYLESISWYLPDLEIKEAK